MDRRCASVHMDIWNTDILPTTQAIPKRADWITCAPHTRCSIPRAVLRGVCWLAQRADSTNTWWNKCMELIVCHVVTYSRTLNPDSSVLSNDKMLLSHESMIRWKMWLGESVKAYQSVCSIHFSVLTLLKPEDNQILTAFAFVAHPDELTE